MNIIKHDLLERYDFSRLENMWLKLVLDVIQELIDNKEICDCQDCILDVSALALNQLKPKYWVSGKFNAFTPPETFLNDPKNLNLAEEVIVQALKQVKTNPHH